MPVKHDDKTIDQLTNIMAYLDRRTYDFKVIMSDKADTFVQMQKGLDVVDTEYFLVFGSDDYMLPNMIEDCLMHADGIENPVISPSFALTDHKLKVISNHINKNFKLSRQMKGSYIPDISLLKTEYARLVDGFISKRDWGYLNHFALYHRLLKLGNCEVKMLKDIGFLYRQLPKSRHAMRYKDRKDIQIHREKMKMIADYYWRC